MSQDLKTSQVSYDITSLGGKYILSEDGQVQEYGPLTISYVGPSGVVVGGQVIGPLVASGVVQVVVGIFAYNPSEGPVSLLVS
ncbi:hypothetical protein HAX54_010553 [Datura stramonium]|uniref:AT-hook motif nuclear-localized protein n=1 Tax=Datura stramonium TaxID=4076 RepID=A0ABS8X056_DATST|nr:hypothetical protein [Datura stramonium]